MGKPQEHEIDLGRSLADFGIKGETPRYARKHDPAVTQFIEEVTHRAIELGLHVSFSSDVKIVSQLEKIEHFHCFDLVIEDRVLVKTEIK